MTLNRGSLHGLGKVIGFTLSHLLKSKANIIIAAILLVIALISVPLISLLANSESADIDVSTSIAISKVWVRNRTDYPLEFDFEDDSPLAEVEFLDADIDTDQYEQRISHDDAFVDIFFDTAKSAYTINIYTSSYTSLSPRNLDYLSYEMQNCFEESRLKSLGVTHEQLDVALSSYYTSSVTAKTYFDSGASRNVELRFLIQYFYSIVVLILGLFSLSYIIRAIIEEKGSNIVELLLVSVKPLSIIAGKIIAVMLYIIGFFLALALTFGVSWLASSFFINTSAVGELISESGISSAMSIGPDSIFVLLLSLLLGYLMIAVMGGISASCCSSMEDMEGAQLSVVFIVLAGYILSSFVPFFDSTLVSVLFVLIPIVSIFTTPISFIFGDISSGVLLLSWGLQALTIIYLSHFCSRVYSDLIIHKGSRIQFRELISISRRS